MLALLTHAGTISHVCHAPLPHWLRITYRTGELVSSTQNSRHRTTILRHHHQRYRDCHPSTDRHLEEQLLGNYVRAMAPHSWQHLTVLLRCDYRHHRISTRLRESKDLVLAVSFQNVQKMLWSDKPGSSTAAAVARV